MSLAVVYLCQPSLLAPACPADQWGKVTAKAKGGR